MTPQRCLDWCVEFEGEACDFRTSMNVLEWLADKAETVADTDKERAAVKWARDMASAVTGPYLRTGGYFPERDQ